MTSGGTKGGEEFMDRAKIIEHIDEHVEYPATAKELKDACEQMSDVSEEDKKWFEEHLPDGTYDSPDDVKMALGMSGDRNIGSVM